MFALGLCVAGVVRPRVVLESFVIGPSWDPSMPLMFLGALAVHAPISFVMRRRAIPLSGAAVAFTPRPTWEPQLLIGAVLFGVGWGLSGICPGPMVASAFTFSPGVLALIAGFALGSWIAPLLSELTTVLKGDWFNGRAGLRSAHGAERLTWP